MRSKILSRKTLLTVILAGFAFSPALLFYLIPESPIQSDLAPPIENTIALPKQELASFGLPVRLKIPEINIDSAVEHVGITSDKAMDTPKNLNNVAWFNLGPRPGESGSAVIAGHYGWKNGKASVFDNLYRLREGDKLSIEDDNGVIISFVVRKSLRYDLKADASDIFSSNDGKPHLNLITCEGTWDEGYQSYPDRLVVFTDQE